MNKGQFIYESPLCQETKTIRRNLLLSSSICLFVGLTNQLPEKIALLGISFNTTEQTTIGWFMFSVQIYFFLHFVANAFVEVAKWVEPFYKAVVERRALLSHPAYDESDFLDIYPPADEHNLDEVEREADIESTWHVQKRLRFLYSFIYLKLVLEIILPIIVSCYGTFVLLSLITRQ